MTRDIKEIDQKSRMRRAEGGVHKWWGTYRCAGPPVDEYCRDVREVRLACLEHAHAALSLAHGPGRRWCHTIHIARGCTAVQCTDIAGAGVTTISIWVVCWGAHEKMSRLYACAELEMESSRGVNGGGTVIYSG